jgi:hypothetical protein
MRIQIFRLLTVLCLQLPFTFAQEAATTKAADPDPLATAESDYILKDFHFVNGESLPELKLHYRTIGQPTSNPSSGALLGGFDGLGFARDWLFGDWFAWHGRKDICPNRG